MGSQLPPPPGDASWRPPAQPAAPTWQLPAPRDDFPPRPGAPIPGDRPAWRTPTAGWVVLHIVIGLAIGFTTSVVEVMIAAAWVPLASLNNPSSDQALRLGSIVLITWGAGTLTWLLFVYLRPRALRLAVFPGVLALVTILGAAGVVHALRPA